MASEQLKKLSEYKEFISSGKNMQGILKDFFTKPLGERDFDFDKADEMAVDWDEFIHDQKDDGLRAISAYKDEYKDNIIQSDIDEINGWIKGWTDLQRGNDPLIHDYLYAVAAMKLVEKDTADLKQERKVHDEKIKAMDETIQDAVTAYESTALNSTLIRIGKELTNKLSEVAAEGYRKYGDKWARQIEEIEAEEKKQPENDENTKFAGPSTVYREKVADAIEEYTSVVQNGIVKIISISTGSVAGFFKSDVVGLTRKVAKTLPTAKLIKRMLERRRERCDYIIKKCYSRNPISDLKDAIGKDKVKHPGLIPFRKDCTEKAKKLVDKIKKAFDEYDKVKDDLMDGQYIQSKVRGNIKDDSIDDYINTLNMELEKLAKELEDKVNEKAAEVQEKLIAEAKSDSGRLLNK